MLSRKLRKKYKKELSMEEELTFFAVRVVGSTALFFLVFVSIDVYRLLH